MKYLHCIIITILFYYTVNAQEDISRIAVNFGFTYPVLTKHANESINIKVDNEIEALYNFKISNNSKLSTGVGFQYGIHHKTQEAEKVMMVDGVGSLPWKYTYYWKLTSLSIKVPMILTVPFKNSYIDFFSTGVSVGRVLNYNLTERNIINPTQIEINRIYMDYSFGVMKYLGQDEKVSIGLSPTLGFRTYFTDFNDWQKNYVFASLNLFFYFKKRSHD